MKRTIMLFALLVAVFTIVTFYMLENFELFAITQNTSEPKTDKKAGYTMPGKMVLDDPDNKVTIYAGDKGKTHFDHDQHIAFDSCVTCHHTNSEKLSKAIEEEVMKCATCHKEEEEESTLDGTNENKKFKGLIAIDSQTAFHGTGQKGSLVGCIDCHKARQDKFPKAKAVMSCKQCHSGG